MTEYTTIRIRTETKESLKDIGKMRDTYSDVIDQLIDMYNGDNI